MNDLKTTNILLGIIAIILFIMLLFSWSAYSTVNSVVNSAKDSLAKAKVASGYFSAIAAEAGPKIAEEVKKALPANVKQSFDAITKHVMEATQKVMATAPSAKVKSSIVPVFVPGQGWV